MSLQDSQAKMSITQESTTQGDHTFILAPRASTILYNFITSNKSHLPYVMPVNICPIVPITFFKAGQAFKFADINPETYSLDENYCLELAHRKEIAGVLLVHTYGEESSHAEFFTRLKMIDPNIFLIDDRCLCKPNFSAPLLTNIDMTLYSTGYGKYIDVGSGGFGWIKHGISYRESHLPFNKRELDELEHAYKASIIHKSIFQYKDENWLDTQSSVMEFEGFTFKIIEGLKEIRQIKNQINQIYHTQLPIQIQFPEIFNEWRFNIRVPNKTKVLKTLFANHLFASSHYASLGGIMAEGSFPNAVALHDQVINLFNDQHYSIEQAQRTAAMINQIL